MFHVEVRMDGRSRKILFLHGGVCGLTHVGPPVMLGLGIRCRLHGGAISVRLAFSTCMCVLGVMV